MESASESPRTFCACRSRSVRPGNYPVRTTDLPKRCMSTGIALSDNEEETTAPTASEAENAKIAAHNYWLFVST